MANLPGVPPSEQNPEQKEAHKYMDKIITPIYQATVNMKGSDGTLLGPFGPLLYDSSYFRAPLLELLSSLDTLLLW